MPRLFPKGNQPVIQILSGDGLSHLYCGLTPTTSTLHGKVHRLSSNQSVLVTHPSLMERSVQVVVDIMVTGSCDFVHVHALVSVSSKSTSDKEEVRVKEFGLLGETRDGTNA